MAKKHAHEEHDNHERWVISFADMMTLLFALFVVLYALKEESLREAQRSIAFYLNLDGFSKTSSEGIFDSGNTGGETATSHTIFSTERGAMKEFVEKSIARFERAGGRSLEFRDTDDGVLYDVALDQLYDGLDDDVRESMRDWLRATVEDAMVFGSLLRLRIEAVEGRVALGGIDGNISREHFCMRRLVKLMRWIEIDSSLREDQIQIEFRHYSDSRARIRSREPWQTSARLSFLFVARP